MDELDELIRDCLEIDARTDNPPQLYVVHSWDGSSRTHLLETAWANQLFSVERKTMSEALRILTGLLAYSKCPQALLDHIVVTDGGYIMGVV